MNLEEKKLEELYALKHSLEASVSIANNKQMAMKILSNALYGSMTNKGFRYNDVRIGEAITLNGQGCDRHLEKHLNLYMNGLLKTDAIDYIAYGDSVTGDSMIEVNGNLVRIDAYFESLDGKEHVDPTAKSYVRPTKDFTTTINPTTKQFSTEKINYAMKHRVNKKMFALHAGNSRVTVTQDHAIMVYRDGEIIAVTPTNCLATDFAIVYSECGYFVESKEFIIEDLGEHDIDVYDLEVEGCHTFFANGILVHNTDSLILNVDALVNRLFPVEKDPLKITKALDKICKKLQNTVIKESTNHIFDLCNCKENLMNYKREAISSKSILCCHPDSKVEFFNEEFTIKELYDANTKDKVILSLNPDTGGFELDLMEEVLRKYYEGVMMEFTFEDGRVLKVTEDHIVFVRRGDIIVQIPAKEVTEEDDFVDMQQKT